MPPILTVIADITGRQGIVPANVEKREAALLALSR
jgi:hypothetical protein